MRFFKYLVFFILFLTPIISQAAWKTVQFATGTGSSTKTFAGNRIFTTAQAVCDDFKSVFGSAASRCQSSTTKVYMDHYGTPVNIANYVPANCPSANTMAIFWYPAGTTQIHTRRCYNGCTYTGTGQSTSYPNYEMTSMFATGNDLNCVDEYNNKTDSECNKSDPYGGCYQPPNDDCVRLSDGSITCPTTTPPPVQPTCGGATYCERPPEGCGEGYVSGSFNGQQLCVKTSPSTPTEPTEPTEPNECTSAYCEKTDNNEDCPSGYYSSYFNGTSICVANNPTPNQPNPNDPNNNNDAGSGSSEPQNGDDPTTNFDVRGIIDAIKALRDSLLTALDKVSKKLTTLVEGQNKTNEHLEKIKDESIKTNDKLDTANGHLTKIEENTKSASDTLDSINDSALSTSEAVGESNKKLDQIFSDQGKQQIEQLGEQSTDSRLTAAESEMTSKLQTLANTLSYSSSHACISDFTITDIPYFVSTTVPFSKYCDLLALIKLLLKLATLMYALRMIDATVRVF